MHFPLRAGICAIAAALGSLAAALPAAAQTYYVSRAGSDTASGISPASAWRTIDRVNHAPLRPGDQVLFHGGEIFADTTLMPETSGSQATPIVFASYGGGRATLQNPDSAVWLNAGASNLRFSQLNLTAGGGPSSVFASSLNGAGSTDIVLSDCALTNSAGAGVISAKHADRNWSILNSTISNTGDSGIIALGADITIRGNEITNTGWSTTISWGRHGIYAKGPRMHIENNTIRGFTGDGISLRFNGDTATGNRISGGPIGIGYFEYADQRGLVKIENNTISQVSAAGVYIDNTSSGDGTGPTRQSFQIENNTISSGAANALDIRHTAGSVTIKHNQIKDAHGLSLRLERPAGQLVETDNLWLGGTPRFALDGRWYSSLPLWQQTGLGNGDRIST